MVEFKRPVDKHGIKKYVYYEYTARDGRVSTGDMNWWEWERIQRDPGRRNQFKAVRIVDLTPGSASPMEETRRAYDSKVALPEVVGDPLECPLCGFVAEDDAHLLQHKSSIHDTPVSETWDEKTKPTEPKSPNGTKEEKSSLHRQFLDKVSGGTRNR